MLIEHRLDKKSVEFFQRFLSFSLPLLLNSETSMYHQVPQEAVGYRLPSISSQAKGIFPSKHLV